ncbi:MAG: DUF2442 domain-containing protein [Peptococcaceae bacterium]|nr:DUF2442 domain-containing protein [Peptococcaceae bacterium]
MEEIISKGTPNWSVTAVEPHEDYTLTVTFVTGEKKRYDVRPLLKYPAFAPLKNLDLFMQAHVECATVVWNDDLDIAPESLYDKGISL